MLNKKINTLSKFMSNTLKHSIHKAKKYFFSYFFYLPQPNNHFLMDFVHQRLVSHWYLNILKWKENEKTYFVCKIMQLLTSGEYKTCSKSNYITFANQCIKQPMIILITKQDSDQLVFNHFLHTNVP